MSDTRRERSRRLHWLVGGLVALAAVVATPTSAHIVLDSCIGGVGVWDEGKTVLRQRGEPSKRIPRAPDVWWRYPKGAILLTPWGRGSGKRLIVLAVRTTDPRERTVSGIGVGSTLRAVRRAYPGRGCGTSGTCEIGGRRDRSTMLRLRGGKVVEVSISLYSDYDDGPLRRADRRCRPNR